jgi:hypothetical protein
LRENKEQLFAFLEAAGLLEKAEEFVEYGVDSIHDALNPVLVSDDVLKTELGFSESDIQSFRK